MLVYAEDLDVWGLGNGNKYLTLVYSLRYLVNRKLDGKKGEKDGKRDTPVLVLLLIPTLEFRVFRNLAAQGLGAHQGLGSHFAGEQRQSFLLITLLV
jgi:hypothetical protein